MLPTQATWGNDGKCNGQIVLPGSGWTASDRRRTGLLAAPHDGRWEWRSTPHGLPPLTTVRVMAEAFDPAAMIVRFQERARAVKSRGIPPIEGPERKRFVDRMELDFMDFAMLGDATAELAEGILTLRIDLRPPAG